MKKGMRGGCESTVVPWKKINITDDGDNDKKKGIVDHRKWCSLP